LQKEFNEQVEKEKELGLEFMPFMAGSGPFALAKGEVGFITFVARPWYHAMADVFPEVKVLVTILGE
jgi:high affinity cGMP-specific 3',5'-cyclic phosphodiesterase 9